MTSKVLQQKMAGKLWYKWENTQILCVQWWCQTRPSFPSTQAAASTFRFVMFECQNISLLLPSQSYSSVLVVNPIGLLLLFFPLFTAAVAHLERTVSQLLWRFSWTWKKGGFKHFKSLVQDVAVPAAGSQVSIGEHGVLLPHSAETFDCIYKFFIIHKL